MLLSRLQEMYESYQNIVQLKKKVKSVIETLKKNNKLTPDIEKSILNARNFSELDFVVRFGFTIVISDLNTLIHALFIHSYHYPGS